MKLSSKQGPVVQCTESDYKDEAKVVSNFHSGGLDGQVAEAVWLTECILSNLQLMPWRIDRSPTNLVNIHSAKELDTRHTHAQMALLLCWQLFVDVEGKAGIIIIVNKTHHTAR